MTQFAKLFTEEGEQLLAARRENPDFVPWDVYPRPALVRDSYLCLNGAWDFCVTDSAAVPKSASRTHMKNPTETWRTILVPFAPQSLLSGVGEDIPDGSYLWYRRTVTIPEGFVKDRLILHIDAADQVATVYVNGREIGSHRGGYSRASFDITDAVYADRNAVQEALSFRLLIRVYDKLADRVFPYGKQSLNRGGMWYTPVSGIWQTVWMESVPEERVEEIDYTVIDRGGAVSVTFDFVGVRSGKLILGGATAGSLITADIIDGTAHIRLPDAHRWTPDDPYLYHYSIHTDHDTVQSYFAVRTVSVNNVAPTGTSAKPVPRICLNGQPVFLNGLLDQGYWSDGLFTPASPDCYVEEITRLKELGFNTLRKHIKIEPDRFYYECDRLGIFVMQDMVNNGEYNFLRDTALPTAGRLRRDDTRLNTDADARSEFKRSLIETVIHLRKHPCIVLWTVFNEGWGQFCGTEMYRLLRSLDKTRLIDTASGWFAGCETDIESRHVYFRKIKAPRDAGTAANPIAKGAGKPFFVTEFGGYTWKPEGHCFNTDKTYGYGAHKTRESLVAAVRKLYLEQVLPLIPGGLCGAVYTQVSDVEDETNGVFSYDRRVQKLLPEDVQDVFATLQAAIE
ncbi:MAG: glycoside hydrolase family 2 [Mogibacterium sp.]|nr:glycoside hydrolase family 2 [Mogibacterium sp.]